MMDCWYLSTGSLVYGYSFTGVRPSWRKHIFLWLTDWWYTSWRAKKNRSFGRRDQAEIFHPHRDAIFALYTDLIPPMSRPRKMAFGCCRLRVCLLNLTIVVVVVVEKRRQQSITRWLLARCCFCPFPAVVHAVFSAMTVAMWKASASALLNRSQAEYEFPTSH